MLDTEEMWLAEGSRWGWRLPPKANWFLRLPIVRRIRAAWLEVRVERHYAGGLGAFGAVRTGYDAWFLIGVFHGWV